MAVGGCSSVDSGGAFTGPWYERVETGPFQTNYGGDGPCFMGSDPCISWPGVDPSLPVIDLSVAVVVEHWLEGEDVIEWTMVRSRAATVGGDIHRDTFAPDVVRLTRLSGNRYRDEGTGECFTVRRSRTLQIESCGGGNRPHITITAETE